MDSIGTAGSSVRRVVRRRRATTWLLLWALHAQVPGASAAASAACAVASLRTPYEPRVFLGYACTDPDCRAHKDGFRWADRHGIVDARACSAGPDEPALREGCRAYADEAVTPEQAGFEWARENEVAESCLCGGAGAAFAAGCEAYVAGFGD